MENIDKKLFKMQHIQGCLIGGAVGDALGYQIEFRKGITERQVTKYKNDLGIISDDTQMTLFTANGLLWRETRLMEKGIAMLPVGALHIAYLNWLETQTGELKDSIICWINRLPELRVQRDPGKTCLIALSSGKFGTPKKPINKSYGCGGLMRIAPIALYGSKFDDVVKLAVDSTALTHGHPLALMSSYIFASILFSIMNENLDLEEVVNKSIETFKKKFQIFNKIKDSFKFGKYKKKLVVLLQKAIELSKMDLQDTEAIKLLGQGWTADECLAIAIYSVLKYQTSFEDAVICAVNHDGDSDSTGSVAGNIIGCYYGIKSIPKYYIEHLDCRDIILEIGKDLANGYCEEDEYFDGERELWLRKYIYVKSSLDEKENKN